MVEEIHLGILVKMLLVVGCWLLVVWLQTTNNQQLTTMSAKVFSG